jgi:di/tricarboxylate transporter
VGRPLAALDLPLSSAAEIIAIERRGPLRTRVLRPGADTELAADDVLLIDSPSPDLEPGALCERFALERLPLSGGYFTDRSQEVGMAEAVVTPDSELVGKTLRQADLRERFDLSPVGLRRRRTATQPEALADETLRVGDTLLLVGPWGAIRRLKAGGLDLVVLNLPQEFHEVLPAARKAPYAVLSLLVTVALMVTGLVPNVQAALIGCLLMGLFRCIDLDSAYRAISLRTLVMIVGMLPFAVALERTGGIALAAHGLIVLVGDAGPLVILATLYAITVLLGLFIVAAANAVLIIPVALAMAAELGASPYPFALTVAFAASSAFMTPMSPMNAMVATPGNYNFGDFIRIGLPLVLIAMTVTLTLVPWLYPLY